MRAVILALFISTATFLQEWLLDTTISVNMYRLYRDIMIGLLAIHCWDVYAERENQKVLALVERGAEKVEEGFEQAGHRYVLAYIWALADLRLVDEVTG
jgi:hypothetical protein